tara:strand:- start:469 stop:1269 length:801 start_codon:yes stop_codon:yes gene_type:complete
MKIKFGISSCPNDTFMFEALINSKIDTQDLDFEFVIEDIKRLNNLSIKNKLDVSKISFGAFFNCMYNYEFVRSGAALGFGCGPLIIQKQGSRKLSRNSTIAIPGKYTTANLLLSKFFPHVVKKEEILFSEIENAVLNKDVDAGLIIHESRFTYLNKGLIKISDLGQLWEDETNSPIPLGGIVIKKEFPHKLKLQIQNLIKSSVLYAYNNFDETLKFVKKHAQEIDEYVIKKHIDLYVNENSVFLKQNGINAIKFLLSNVKGNKIFF